MERKTTSFKINPKIWRMVKVYCAKKEIDIADFLEDIINKELNLKIRNSRKDDLKMRFK